MKSPLHSDHDPKLDDDTVWGLINQTPAQKASPTFIQDTLRRARLESQETPQAWWKQLFSAKPLAGITATAFAIVYFGIFFASTKMGSKEITQSPETSSDELEILVEEALASELLLTASEDQSLFSDEEILALLF